MKQALATAQAPLLGVKQVLATAQAPLLGVKQALATAQAPLLEVKQVLAFKQERIATADNPFTIKNVPELTIFMQQCCKCNAPIVVS